MMMTAIGLMSGTSLDGVDVALIETDGKRVQAFGPTGYRSYTETERGLLRQALAEAVHLPQRDARPGILREAERAVTLAHAEAVATFTAQNRIAREDVDIVGFHGQTVLHRPAQRMTVQIGDAAALARAIHIPVMHDFRAADVAAGGQGAPFVPVYHRALAQSLQRSSTSGEEVLRMLVTGAPPSFGAAAPHHRMMTFSRSPCVAGALVPACLPPRWLSLILRTGLV
jgi:anhydro-N-acetylmuramic acid kinase